MRNVLDLIFLPRHIESSFDLFCRDEPSLTMPMSGSVASRTAAPSESNIRENADRATPDDIASSEKTVSVGPALQFSARRNAVVVQKGLGWDKRIQEFWYQRKWRGSYRIENMFSIEAIRLLGWFYPALNWSDQTAWFEFALFWSGLESIPKLSGR
jgi:hypothetical protein